jgi:hypothetical protein
LAGSTSLMEFSSSGDAVCVSRCAGGTVQWEGGNLGLPHVLNAVPMTAELRDVLLVLRRGELHDVWVRWWGAAAKIPGIEGPFWAPASGPGPAIKDCKVEDVVM